MKPDHFLRKLITASQDLSAGALSFTTTIGRNFKLEEVNIKVNVNITETITITRDSKSGTLYDVRMLTEDLVAKQLLIFRPTGECNFVAGDELKVHITNANATGIPKIEIRTSEM